ncbi:MAG: hypothetical protein ACT4QD_03665 [Acidobacteriota bacterium]
MAAWPARRLIGVNFVVTEQTVPLGRKVLEFLERDRALARAARDAVGDARTDEERTFAALKWTAARVRPQPVGQLIVDDHVSAVIARGYGEADQQADVFTTLLVYAGVSAYWGLVGTPPRELPLSYVRIDGRWRVFDVAGGLTFRTDDGQLASPDDVAADLGVVRRAAQARVADLDFYLAYFHGYRPPLAPDVVRADLQMPWRRLRYEAGRMVGRSTRGWQIRPEPAPPMGQGSSTQP